MAETGQATEAAAAGNSKGGRKGLLFLFIGVQILVLAVVAWLFLRPHDKATPATAEAAHGEAAKAEQKSAPEHEVAPIYLPLKPPFVVNVRAGNGRMRFLQVAVEVMAHEQPPITAVQDNMPLIRNNLLLLFGSQTIADVISLDGKQKLREAALAEVRRVLKQQKRSDSITALYFSSFVVQ